MNGRVDVGTDRNAASPSVVAANTQVAKSVKFKKREPPRVLLFGQSRALIRNNGQNWHTNHFVNSMVYIMMS